MIEWKIIAPEIEYLIGAMCFFGSMFAWSYPAIFFHECGHALAAYLLGFTPQSIEIGTGERVLFTHQYLTINWVIKERPYGGRTLYSKAILTKGTRWRKTVIAGAGLLTDGVILICLSLLVFFPTAQGYKTLGKISLGLFVPQFLSLLVSLIPRNIHQNGESYPNDTKKMWLYLTGKEQNEIKKAMEGVSKILVLYYDRNYQPNASSGFFIDEGALLRKYFEAKKILEEMQFDKAITLFKEVINSDLLQNAEKAYVLDNMARVPTIYGQKKYLEEAIAWIEEAMRLAPSARTLQGTYGSLLIESDQIDRAIEVLKVVVEDSEVLIRAMASAYLAQAYDRLGDQEQTGFWSERQIALEAQL
jgi:hypothetical protein